MASVPTIRTKMLKIKDTPQMCTEIMVRVLQSPGMKTKGSMPIIWVLPDIKVNVLEMKIRLFVIIISCT